MKFTCQNQKWHGENSKSSTQLIHQAEATMLTKHFEYTQDKILFEKKKTE